MQLQGCIRKLCENKSKYQLLLYLSFLISHLFTYSIYDIDLFHFYI